MTVIAWDGKTLAADKRMTDEFGRRGVVTKIGLCSAGLYGITGDELVGRAPSPDPTDAINKFIAREH